MGEKVISHIDLGVHLDFSRRQAESVKDKPKLRSALWFKRAATISQDPDAIFILTSAFFERDNNGILVPCQVLNPRAANDEMRRIEIYNNLFGSERFFLLGMWDFMEKYDIKSMLSSRGFAWSSGTSLTAYGEWLDYCVSADFEDCMAELNLNPKNCNLNKALSLNPLTF